MQNPKFSIIIVTYERDTSLKTNLERIESLVSHRKDVEVLLVDNNVDGFDRSGMLKRLPNARYRPQHRNLGVSGGRNAGINHSRGEFLIFIDDDALLNTDAPLDTIERIFDEDPYCGILAFRSSVRFQDHWVYDPKEFPHTNKYLHPEKPFETFRFIGVGHAIRRKVLLASGNYLESFMYGMEEFDLSFRVMRLGWKIRYSPEVSVLHLKDLSGRHPAREVIERSLTNKLCIAWMHLPFPEMLVCMCVWTCWSALKSRCLRTCIRAWAAFRHRHLPAREPIDAALARKIRRLGGTLWK